MELASCGRHRHGRAQGARWTPRREPRFTYAHRARARLLQGLADPPPDRCRRGAPAGAEGEGGTSAGRGSATAGATGAKARISKDAAGMPAWARRGGGHRGGRGAGSHRRDPRVEVHALPHGVLSRVPVRRCGAPPRTNPRARVWPAARDRRGEIPDRENRDDGAEVTRSLKIADARRAPVLGRARRPRVARRASPIARRASDRSSGWHRSSTSPSRTPARRHVSPRRRLHRVRVRPATRARPQSPETFRAPVTRQDPRARARTRHPLRALPRTTTVPSSPPSSTHPRTHRRFPSNRPPPHMQPDVPRVVGVRPGQRPGRVSSASQSS